MPIRQRIIEPLKDGDMGAYVIKAPDDVSLKDIMLASEPLSCWILKIADHLVVVPLSGDSRTSEPLREMQRLSGGQTLDIEVLASWSFPHSGRSAPFRLIWLAPTPPIAVGLRIRGTLPNGRPLEGTCISTQESPPPLLCPAPAIRRAGIDHLPKPIEVRDRPSVYPHARRWTRIKRPRVPGFSVANVSHG